MSLIFLVVPLSFDAAFFAVVLYHLKRYGFKDDASKRLTVAFIAGSLLIASCVVASYLFVDWSGLTSFFSVDFSEIFSNFSL